ncbi:MAG: hypothetical protein H7832_15560 [Magnetococcus sp. DMHC-6]
METVSIQLPDDVSIRLRDLEQLTGNSKAFYIIEAIRDHLDDLENVYIAEQRLLNIRAGRSQTVPLEDVMKRYGMEN